MAKAPVNIEDLDVEQLGDQELHNYDVPDQ